MLALTVLSQQWVAPQMARLRQQMGSVERAPEDSPPRVQFNRLHRFSVRLEAFVLLAGLAAFFLVVRETMR